MTTGYNFSDNVRQAMNAARSHAARLGHDYVAPDHFVLGILDLRECVATTALLDLGARPDALAAAIESGMEKGGAASPGPDLPYTSRAKRVLELAMTEAKDLGHSYVGTEHVLLGVLRDEKSGAAAALAEQKLTADSVRPAIVRVMRMNRQSIARPGPGLMP